MGNREIWQNWLKSEQGYSIVDSCADSFCKRYRSLILRVFETPIYLQDKKFKRGSVHEGDSGVAGLSLQDIITNELWFYLSDEINIERLNISIFNNIIERNYSTLRNQIFSKLLSRIRDLDRSGPKKYFYRIARQTIQKESKKDSRITYFAKKKSAYYSYSLNPEPLDDASTAILEGHRSHGYSQWDMPVGPINPKDITARETILMLAELFWNQSRIFLNGNYLMPVRELTFYAFSKYKLTETIVSITTDDDEQGGKKEIVLPDATPMIGASFLAKDYENELAVLAGKVVESLKGDHLDGLKVLVLKSKEVELLEMEQMEIKSPNYHLNIVNEMIGREWTSWMPRELKDDDELKAELRNIFLEQILFYSEQISMP